MLFRSNFAGFSIFKLEVRIRTSSTGRPGACAAAILAPTNLAISSGVSIVASCAPVGSLAPGGDLPVGRFCTYKSLSLLLGSGEGEGNMACCPGLGGEPPPLPPAPPAAGSGGSSGSGGGLEGGIADHLSLLVGGTGASQMGLWRAGPTGSGVVQQVLMEHWYWGVWPDCARAVAV